MAERHRQLRAASLWPCALSCAPWRFLRDGPVRACCTPRAGRSATRAASGAESSCSQHVITTTRAPSGRPNDASRRLHARARTRRWRPLSEREASAHRFCRLSERTRPLEHKGGLNSRKAVFSDHSKEQTTPKTGSYELRSRKSETTTNREQSNMLPLRFRTRRHAGVPELSEKRPEISRICPRTTPASSVWFRIAHDALYDGSANRTQTKAHHIDNLPPAVSQPPERNHDSKSATQLQVRSCDLLLLRDNQHTFLWESSVKEKKKRFIERQLVREEKSKTSATLTNV